MLRLGITLASLITMITANIESCLAATDATTATWEPQPFGGDLAKIGRYQLIVWTGTSYVDPNGGTEVCDLYVPLGDRHLPDGKMLVNRRDLETTDRAAARDAALRVASEAIANFEAP